MEQAHDDKNTTARHFLRNQSPWFWFFAVVVISLNVWFDVYHPGGFILDGAILLFILNRVTVAKKNRADG